MKNIRKIHFLLVRLMGEGFSNKSLLENKKIIDDLREFQKNIFYKNQSCGDPKYEPTELEKELKEIEDKILEIIFVQMGAGNINSLESEKLMALHKDYKTYFPDIKSDYSKKVDSIKSSIVGKILEMAKEEKDKDEKIKLLFFVTKNSQTFSKEYEEAEILLEKFGLSDEQLHLKSFGERPK